MFQVDFSRRLHTHSLPSTNRWCKERDRRYFLLRSIGGQMVRLHPPVRNHRKENSHDTINVNGETYTKVPDEISLFGRTYRLVDDTIPEPLDVSEWHPIEPDYRITLREYMTRTHPEDAKRNLTGLGQVVKNTILNAGKGDLLEENGNGATIYARSLFPLVEQGYRKWRSRNNAHIMERSVAEV